MWYSPVMARTRRRPTRQRRLVSEHFLRSGKPKRSFKTRAEAVEFLTETKQTHLYHKYQCPFCLNWHIAKN